MTIKQTRTRVAVYGTLKKSQANHILLNDSPFLGRDFLYSIALYNLGPFPAAREQPSDGVVVEVYEVDEFSFALLDELEGYNAETPEAGLYTRKLFDTAYGQAWLYLFNERPDHESRIPSGNWTGSKTCA